MSTLSLEDLQCSHALCENIQRFRFIARSFDRRWESGDKHLRCVGLREYMYATAPHPSRFNATCKAEPSFYYPYLIRYYTEHACPRCSVLFSCSGDTHTNVQLALKSHFHKRWSRSVVFTRHSLGNNLHSKEPCERHTAEWYASD